MKRVLIATDGSDHALKAAELGTELAIKMDGAELHILAVAFFRWQCSNPPSAID